MTNLDKKSHHDAIHRMATLFLGCEECMKQLETITKQLEVLKNHLESITRNAKMLGNSVKMELDNILLDDLTDDKD